MKNEKMYTMCMSRSEHEKSIVFLALGVAEDAEKCTSYCQKLQEM